MDLHSTDAIRHRLTALVVAAGRREACALLYGTADRDRLILDRVVPVRNLYRGAGGFAFRASVLEAVGAPPLALFHSHPRDLAPSRADLAMFRRTPFKAQLIGALTGSAFRCAAFDPHGQEIPLSWH
jgi:hypothetical protein